MDRLLVDFCSEHEVFVARIELIILSISRVKAVDYQFQFLESMRSSQLGSPSGDWGRSAEEVPGHRARAATWLDAWFTNVDGQRRRQYRSILMRTACTSMDVLVPQ